MKPRIRLQHIKDSIDAILRDTAAGKEAFLKNDTLQRSVAMSFMIIGEAAKNLPREFEEANPQIPWKKVIHFRNFIAHEYFALDPKLVWSIVEEDLPELREVIESALRATESDDQE